ncbi:hypothetical protein K3175_06035 [Qipengyuania sp. GH1]|uniref:hypothetical protein n=1 Tax=Qipengyuania aestuarii TaxID=2867241 RepID=UPI001C86D1A0|nr:hypothetical protein [Qipengyuania aestuarii]MBX7535214.1 hypothetical protein [Qipengyuania aestuarii]
MAEIPVEKKSSLSWLWWLLLLAGVIALIWWLIEGTNGDDELVADETVIEEPYVDDTAVTDPAGDTGVDGEVTALTGLAGLASLGDMIGRDVRLSDVAVNEVVGDEGFTVGEGDNETLVMFDEYPTPNTPMEGQVDVNPGSRVTIEGEVRAFPGDLPESVTREVDTSATAMIFASRVDTVE